MKLIVPRNVKLTPNKYTKVFSPLMGGSRIHPIVFQKFMQKRKSMQKPQRTKRVNWLKESLERQKEIYKQIEIPAKFARYHRNS